MSGIPSNWGLPKLFNSEDPNDKGCQKHADRKHCWHQDGNIGFSGKNKTVTPVVCCHCKRTAKLTEYKPQSSIEYD